MEVIKWAVAAAVIVAASPTAAAVCVEAVPALEVMEKNGYQVTFSDIDGSWILMMAEDGKGGWVMFALKGNALCPLASGSAGVHVPAKPNV